MKIAVIGTIVRDVLELPDGSVTHSLGGLLYTINALRACLDESDTVRPFCAVGKDVYSQVNRMYRNDPIVDLSGLIPVPGQNNRVRVVYHSREDRSEYSLSPLLPLSFDQVERALECDAVIINMVSGWDIHLETMKKIRKHFPGLIALDVHSLTLGRKENGLRYLCYPDRITEWIECADIVQMNEAEFKLITEKYPSPEFFWTASCFKQPKIINLTFGSRGSRSYLVDPEGVLAHDSAPYQGIEVVDPTGCGDAFMAGFLVGYLRSRDWKQAADQANRVAAVSGAFKGLPEPRGLKEKLEELHD